MKNNGYIEKADGIIKDTLYEIFELFYLKENKLLNLLGPIPKQYSTYIIGRKKNEIDEWNSSKALLPRVIWDSHPPMYDTGSTNDFIKKKKDPSHFSRNCPFFYNKKPG